MVALDQILTAESRTQGERWLLGGQPTIIDAHAVPMIRRLMDRERTELVPSAVLAYAKGVMESDEWDRTVHGRAVTYDRSYGPAKDLNPM
jgi:glutathione S-transferase